MLFEWGVRGQSSRTVRLTNFGHPILVPSHFGVNLAHQFWPSNSKGGRVHPVGFQLSTVKCWSKMEMWRCNKIRPRRRGRGRVGGRRLRRRRRRKRRDRPSMSLQRWKGNAPISVQNHFIHLTTFFLWYYLFPFIEFNLLIKSQKLTRIELSEGHAVTK